MPYQTILVSNAPNREIRSLRGLGRHFFTKQEITVTVIDAGNSQRGLNSCKPIRYKTSLVVPRELLAYFAVKTSCTSRPFLAKIPDSFAIQAGSCPAAIEL